MSPTDAGEYATAPCPLCGAPARRAKISEHTSYDFDCERGHRFRAGAVAEYMLGVTPENREVNRRRVEMANRHGKRLDLSSGTEIPLAPPSHPE